MEKEFLNIVSHKTTVETLYQSGLSDQESILLTSFLLVLRKEGILPLNPHNKEDDKRSEIITGIDASNNEVLKSLSNKFLQPILGSIKPNFLNHLLQVYSNLDEKFVKNNLKEFFDNQLNVFLGYKGKHTTDAFQPRELTQLMNYFLPKGKNVDYYNPFGGLASLALELPKGVNYYGEENEQTTWVLAKLRMLVYNTPEYFRFDHVNSIEQWHHSTNVKYDYIAFNPPFNVRLDDSYISFLGEEKFGNARNANSLIVSQCFKKLKKNGKMAFVLPGGFLVSNTEKDLAFRKFLVDNNFLELVISLPNRILNFTSIPIHLIVLNKEKTGEEIRFIDGSKFYQKENPRINIIDIEELISVIEMKENSTVSKKVTSSEIRLFNYNLAVTPYVYEAPEIFLKEDEKLTPLSEILVRVPRSRPTEKEGRVINIKDLAGDRLDPQLNLENIEIKEVKPHYNSVSKKALLISSVGNGLQPTSFYPKGSEKIFVSPNISVFSVDESLILPEYLILELHKEYIYKQLQQFRIGTQIPRLNRRELLSIKVVLPNLDVQKQHIAKEKYELYQEKAIEVKELANSYDIDVADENSFLRHQIAGSLRNVRSSFKKLKSILEEKVKPEFPGLYELKLKDQIPSNLEDYLERLERDIQSITRAVNQAGTDIELSDIHVERIDLIKFVQKYKEELQSSNGGRYSIEVDIDPAALAENRTKSVFINGDKELLRKMFDNIIDNADKHGFERKINPSNKIKFEFLYDFEGASIQLDITNTGKPLPEDYSHEAFVRKGSSSGLNAGDGTGGWFINEVMKKHNGHFGFTDETGPEGIEGEFVTSIELKFPIHLK